MANSITHASLPYPIKNARYTVLVPYLDADGDPTDPTTPDTEVSQDGGSFADAAEEVTTVTGSNGLGYVTLTGAETNNSAVGVAFKVASGPKATLMMLYPRNLPILESGTAGAGAAGSITLASGTYTGINLAGCFVRTTGGTGGGGTGGASNQARRITSYNTGTRVATVTPNWETTPDNTTTYDILLPEGILIPMLTALAPTTLARTLDVSATGEAGIDWANVGSPTTTVGLTGTTIATTQKVDLETIKTNPVVNGGTITFPTNATVASTTNITAATGVVLSGVTHTGAVIPTVTTTTTATNLTNERAKYMHGAVWIGMAANTNTTNYTDGIMTNPVSTIAAAKTIADSLGLKRFWVQAGVTVTLGAAYDGYVFDGFGWTFATTGGTRSISGSVIRNSMNVSGTFSGASPPYFDGCEFGTGGATLPACNATHCEFNSGTITLGTGNYDFIDCASVVAGTSTPVFDCNSPGAAQNISFRRWSGGITLNNINSNTTVSIDMVSGGTVTLNGDAGNVQIRGMAAGITDNRTGVPTLGQNAALNRTVLATPTNITAGTITTVSGNVNGSVGSVAGAVGSVTGNVGGNVVGSVGSVTGAVGSVTGAVGSVTGAVGSIGTGGIAATSFAAGAIDAAAIANGAIDAATFAAGAIDATAIATGAIDADALAADAVTEIWSKAMAELSAVPGVTGTVLEALTWVFTLARNKITQTATQQIVYKDDTTTPLGTSGVTDDATTFTRGEFG